MFFNKDVPAQPVPSTTNFFFSGGSTTFSCFESAYATRPPLLQKHAYKHHKNIWLNQCKYRVVQN